MKNLNQTSFPNRAVKTFFVATHLFRGIILSLGKVSGGAPPILWNFPQGTMWFTAIASWTSFQVTTVRRPLMIISCWKKLKQFCSMYLRYHSQCPSYPFFNSAPAPSSHHTRPQNNWTQIVLTKLVAPSKRFLQCKTSGHIKLSCASTTGSFRTIARGDN